MRSAPNSGLMRNGRAFGPLPSHIAMTIRTIDTAVNIEITMPSPIVMAKPLTGPDPSANSIVVAIRVVTLESTIVLYARRNPASSAARALHPLSSSPRMRSLIRMLASTARPMPSTMPAMPGNVRVAPSALRAATVSTTLMASARFAINPQGP